MKIRIKREKSLCSTQLHSPGTKGLVNSRGIQRVLIDSPSTNLIQNRLARRIPNEDSNGSNFTVLVSLIYLPEMPSSHPQPYEQPGSSLTAGAWSSGKRDMGTIGSSELKKSLTCSGAAPKLGS